MPKKKKEQTWDEIGESIGKKIERTDWEGCGSKWKSWSCNYHETGGGFGRLLFIVGLLYALSYTGYLQGIPTWTIVLIAIGFALMKF